MKEIQWNEEKNSWLKQKRKIGFEDISAAIIEGKLLGTVNHPNKEKYPHQRVFIVNIGNYIYLVPFVEDPKKIFLKTVIPSRKATRDYIIHKKKIV